MAKRFTDTTKWDKAWFRRLTPKMKCVWQFLCDRCDHAGIWEIDLESMAFHIGDQTSLDEIVETFTIERVGKDKLFLRDFIEFQYGNLNPANRVHKSILDQVEKLKIKGLERTLKGSMDMELELELELEKEESSRETKKTTASKFDFEPLYREYPLKKGKTRGLSSCKAQIKTSADYEALKRAIGKYRDQCTAEKTEAQFIKHFDTFMNCWRDYLDDDVGTALVSPQTAQGSFETEAEYVRQAIKSFGTFRPQEAKEWLGEGRWRAVSLMGGWATLCRMPADQFTHKALVKALSESFAVGVS